MRAYLAYSLTTLKLTFRDRMVLFFSYLFPLLFFVLFAQIFGADEGGGITQILSMVFIIGVLGGGFFGGGMRAVTERDLNILRRFKVAPISPGPILAASLFTGWLTYLPSVAFFLLLAHWWYGMPIPENLGSLFAVLSLGIVSFRAVGLIIASVVNSPQESQVVIQLLYLPMLFLSGATFPLTYLPQWLQIIAHYMPATYLYTSLQGILLRKETLWENGLAAAALVVTAVVSVFLSMKLFRWEKDEKVSTAAKLWLATAMAPFLLLGFWQTYSRQELARVQILAREARRQSSYLVTDARLVGEGGRLQEGVAILIRNGKVERIYGEPQPGAKSPDVRVINGTGRTVLPGLIDAEVHLSLPGGIPASGEAYDYRKNVRSAVGAYLFCGVVAVNSFGEDPGALREERRRMESGELLAPEMLLGGPVFAPTGGAGFESLRHAPDSVKQLALRYFVRTPSTPEQAQQQLAALHAAGVRLVKAVLEEPARDNGTRRMDPEVFHALASGTQSLHMKLWVRTQTAEGVREAVGAGASVIELGSAEQVLEQELFETMARRGVYFAPELAAAEAIQELAAGRSSLISRPLVEQVTPRAALERFRTALAQVHQQARGLASTEAAHRSEILRQNLLRAYQAGVRLLAASGSGDALLMHGPVLHRELQLWVQAGVPPAAALAAATEHPARLLGAAGRLGCLQPGCEASLLIVEGDPLAEISSTERVTSVIYKGERINRGALLQESRQ